MLTVAVRTPNSSSTRFASWCATCSIPGSSRQHTTVCLTGMVRVRFRQWPKPFGGFLRLSAKFGCCSISTAFASMWAAADDRLFAQETCNTRHLLHDSLPPLREQHHYLCGLLTIECAWSRDHATSSVTAVLPPPGQRCGTVCLNSFGNRTSPSDNDRTNDR